MADSLPKQIEERIDLVDSWIDSPEKRSHKVWKVIAAAKDKEKITNWDIICFCAAYLKQNVSVFIWLMDIVKPLGRLIFNAHYFATEETGLLLDLNLNGIQQKSTDTPKSEELPRRATRFE